MTQYRKVAPALIEQRRDARHRVEVACATVRPHGKRPVLAMLHDISVYGARIKSPLRHGAGDRVWLRFDGRLPIAATVVWSDAGYAGCRFDEPIERALVRSLVLADG